MQCGAACGFNLLKNAAPRPAQYKGEKNKNKNKNHVF
jgi:hypothetical protein